MRPEPAPPPPPGTVTAVRAPTSLQRVLDAHFTRQLGWLVAALAALGSLAEALRRRLRRARLERDVDATTGLLTRGGLLPAAAFEVERARGLQRPLTVAVLDVDRFHLVNSHLGRGAGDQLLRQLAQAARAELRSVDLVGRLDADQFALVLPDLSARDAAAVLARLEARLELVVRPFPVALGVSVGSVSLPQVDADLEGLLRLADRRRTAVKGRHLALVPAARA